MSATQSTWHGPEPCSHRGQQLHVAGAHAAKRKERKEKATSNEPARGA